MNECIIFCTNAFSYTTLYSSKLCGIKINWFSGFTGYQENFTSQFVCGVAAEMVYIKKLLTLKVVQ